jgi:long-subunit fatty acid transport protein
MLDARGMPLSSIHLTALIAGVVAVSLMPRASLASMLLAPAVGAADSATNGSVVGIPATPESALFTNPAGLAAFEHTTHSASFGAVFPSATVDSDAADYNRSDDRVAFVPSAGSSFRLRPDWTFAVGVYGTTGTTFDFEAEPPGVPTDFLSDVAIGGMPIALAYEASPRLWLGAELVPLFGYLRNRYTLIDPTTGGAIPVEYTLRGPGIGAMVGATWIPTDEWSLGLSVRTPGMIWMDGSTPIAGDRRDVDLDLEMPTTVWGGATRHFGERLDVSASVRWTDSSVFGESKIEYASFAIPFVPDAHDEWRFALGAELDASERLTVRAGTSYASRIVGNRGVSPLLYDTEDIKLSGGLGYRIGAWKIDVTAGYQFEGKRTVAPSDALILPGTYEASGPIVMIGAVLTL